MSRLDDLRKNLLEMDESQLLETIRNIRGDRRVSKTEKTQRVAKQKTSTNKFLNALAKLSPAEKEALLKELGD